MLWFLAVAFAAEPDVLMDAAAAELTRSMDALKGTPDAPYWIGLELTDFSWVTLSAEDGALGPALPRHSRRVDVDVRVGSPRLDSSHTLRSERPDENARSGRSLPIDDDPAVLRRVLWTELDQRVRDARERWAKVSADKATLVAEVDAPDLVLLPPVTASEPLVSLTFDPAPWGDVLRRTSAHLAGGVVRDGQVTLSAEAQNQWYLSTDGERVRHGRLEYRLSMSVDAVADDGTVLRLYQSWEERDPAALPSEAALIAAADAMRGTLGDLTRAPEQEPYSGPVVLSDRAAGVFFHEIFGHRMEGHRLKRTDNAQTFKDMVGQPILPTFLSVVDDPTLTTWGDRPLRGAYTFDDQGAPSQRTLLIEDGVLRGFLQSRSPHTATGTTNGHGRAEPGKEPVSRQGNLIVTARVHQTDAELRAALIRAAKEQGKPYALWIDDIQGGFTFTNRGTPNAFQVDVLVAHRVWVDGRPDELVRGIDLIGTPLVAFGRIAAAGESHAVFNGACGAESGWVPVSAVAPSLLVTQLETQRKRKGQETPPLLPPPSVEVTP